MLPESITNGTMQDMKSQGKVFVGMSGGVDSSISAALLKKGGYHVTGVFIKVWQPDWLKDKAACTWKEDRLDAMRVCAKLEIPFITLDLEKEYKKEVVDYMVGEYRAGRTPNPDVMCNRYVKFGGFYDWAIGQGADFIATGHYCINKNGNLLMGHDQNKDQSYFLWTIKKEQLQHVLFPVGNIEKSETRKLAKKFGLPNAEKKDSQGLCFIGKIDIKEFLSHYIESKKGNVLDEKGNVVGSHNGALFYTIGERHGFVITEKTPDDSPCYVISKDVENNTITVGNRIQQEKIGIKRIKIKDINWISEIPKKDSILYARSRYRETLQKIKMIDENTVEFKKEQTTISPGQSLVVYDGNVCVGGGIIMS